MFLILCPKCKNRMKYQPATATLQGKKKQCVYCGFQIKVKDNIVREIK